MRIYHPLTIFIGKWIIFIFFIRDRPNQGAGETVAHISIINLLLQSTTSQVVHGKGPCRVNSSHEVKEMEC